MLAIAIDLAKLVQEGYIVLWDSIVYKFISNHYRDETKFMEHQVKKKGITLRLIVEITKDNLNFLNSLHYYEIIHLDRIRNNMGIFDKRAYMVAIFHNESI